VDVAESDTGMTLRTTSVPARLSNYFDEGHGNRTPIAYHLDWDVDNWRGALNCHQSVADSKCPTG